MSALCNTSVKLTSILPIAYDGEVLLRSLVKQVSTENDSALAHRFPLLVAHMEKLSHASIASPLRWRLKAEGVFFFISWVERWTCDVFSIDGGEPNGHDQLPWGFGENAGDRGATSEEESEERSGAFFSASGLKHLWFAGLYCLWAHRIGPRIWGIVQSTHTSIWNRTTTSLMSFTFLWSCVLWPCCRLSCLSNSYNVHLSALSVSVPRRLSNYLIVSVHVRQTGFWGLFLLL